MPPPAPRPDILSPFLNTFPGSLSGRGCPGHQWSWGTGAQCSWLGNGFIVFPSASCQVGTCGWGRGAQECRLCWCGWPLRA